MFADIPDAAAPPPADAAESFVPETFERTARTRADDDFTPGSSYPRPAQEAAQRAEVPRLATSSHIEEIDSIPSVDDAVDLYELGAVDYEPENAHHNA
jgi:hypothetical protein